jgi:DnaJ-class molecular chaperone
VAIVEARDYYQILRVDPEAEPEVIAAAYRKLAAMYHPDVDSSPDAVTRMQEINLAYGVLKDPEQRASYDRARGIWHAQRAAASARPARPPAASTGIDGFARAILMMIVSSLVVTVILNAFAGPGGKFFAVALIVGLLLWKGGTIFRYFSGRG